MSPEIVQHKLTKLPIKDLKFDEKNPNKMTAEQEQALATSMKKLGYDEYVIVQRHEIDNKGRIKKKFTNMIAHGEHRTRHLIEDGHKFIYCIYRDMTEQERILIRQTHNKLHGQHDPVLDKAELKLLEKMGYMPDLSELIAIPIDDLLHQIRDDGRFATREADENPLEHSAETYLEGNIKQIVLFFNNDEYKKIIPKVEALHDRFKVDNHTEVFIRVFNEWWNDHADNPSS